MGAKSNTQYFHQAIAKRERKNRITYLCNPDGTQSTTQDQIAQTLNNYFINTFSTNLTHVDNVPPLAYPQSDTSWQNQQPGHEDNTYHHQGYMTYTHSKPTLQELHNIIKSMRSGGSPGPDGFNAGFYKQAWPWIASDVPKMVNAFYTQAFMDPQLNQTFLVLIPTKIQSIMHQDFRPISLCNVIYRIIAKFLAGRLKPLLPNFIDQAQAAFVQNRYISTDVVITQEIVHSFHLKN